MGAAIESKSDFWLFLNLSHAKKVKAHWFVEMVGPSPAAGAWTEMKSLVGADAQKSWAWTPKDPQGDFSTGSATWIFNGQEPVYSWTRNRWGFFGAKVSLKLSEKEKQLLCKFQVVTDQAIQIMKNSKFAESLFPKIKATYDRTYFFNQDAQKNVADLEQDQKTKIPWSDQTNSEELTSLELTLDTESVLLELGIESMKPCGIRGIIKARDIEIIGYTAENELLVGLDQNLVTSDESVKIQIKTDKLGLKSEYLLIGKILQLLPLDAEKAIAKIALQAESIAFITEVEGLVKAKQGELSSFFTEARGVDTSVTELSSADADALLKKYLVSNHILIVDKVSSARVSLASSLVKLGALRKNMSLVGSFSEARDVIAAHQPKVIFSDYLIGNQSGFDFIQEQKLEYEQKKITDSICILITANASQSAAARAAEEDVDHFVIKPYTFNLLHKAIRESVQTKLSPNRYLTLISQGKHALAQGEIQRSLGFFSNAMNYDRKPTLALYYLAKLHEKNNDFAEAEKYFREGLEINKIHYKCLSGLHDLLWAQKKHQEAYKIVKKIVDYFPANSRRLSNVLRAAIITDSFQDMEGFYEIFLNIEERTDELIRYMCSALVITGKYYLNRDLKRKALDLFDAAAVSSAGRTKFLLYIVETLVQFKFPADADKYLKRMRALDSGSSDYLAAKFLVSAMVDPAIDAIHLGRQTVQAGALFPSVFEKLIELSLENGFGDSAEELIFQAKRLWPEKDFPVAAKV